MVCFALGIFLPPLLFIGLPAVPARSAPAGCPRGTCGTMRRLQGPPTGRHDCSYIIIANSGRKVNAICLVKHTKNSLEFLCGFYLFPMQFPLILPLWAKRPRSEERRVGTEFGAQRWKVP